MASTDHIETLAMTHERDFAIMLREVFQKAIGTLETNVVTSMIDDIDANHIREQLGIGLDMNGGLPGDLAESEEAAAALVISLAAAVAAHAAAKVGHGVNPKDALLVAAQRDAAQLVRIFYADIATAFAHAIETAIYGSGNSSWRAEQLRRSIGLTVKQAASLELMRSTLHQYVTAPLKVIGARVGPDGVRIPPAVVRNIDTRRLLSATRGHLSAAQRQLLTKALGNPKLTLAQAKEILDNHADALRDHRVRAVAGELIHNVTESAKLTGWRIAQRAGALSSDQRRYWKTAGDERVRHTHAQVPAMNPGGVPLNKPFKTPLGDHFIPPLEYGCRCKSVLVRP